MKVPQSELDIDLVKTILGEYKMHNADIVLRSDCTAEELIDVVEGNRVYIPCIYILNKIDQISIEVRNQEEFSSAHFWELWESLKSLSLFARFGEAKPQLILLIM